MKFETMHCPDCGALATGILEQVKGNANSSEPDENGHVEYTGNTDIFWDEQEPVGGGDEYNLLCEDGHVWLSKRLDLEEDEEDEALSAQMKNR